MKTNILITATLLCLMVSCDTHYRMVSRIAGDGSMYREVYTHTDSVRQTKEGVHNPFLFQTGANWQVEGLDSGIVFDFWGAQEKLNIKAYRKISAVNGQCFSVSKDKEYAYPLAVPQEQLKKRCKWFYTYYTYTATYKELPDKGPVPLDNYLNKAEQTLWLRGDNTFYTNLNGMEANEHLSHIESKFMAWYIRNLYEISSEVIRHFALAQNDTTYTHQWEKLKEAVYKKHLERVDQLEKTAPEAICGFLDQNCQTDYFSQLYKAKQEEIETTYEKRIGFINVFYHNIRFELIMPGKLISSNAGIIDKDTAVWRVNAFRLLAGDYMLTAKSRVVNYWAFGITLLIILAALGVFITLYRRCT